MRKKVWIFNHYAISPQFSGGTRHFDFAKELNSKGYDVTIIASSFHYNEYRELQEYAPGQNFKEEIIDGVRYIWVKTLPYQVNNWKRIVNMISFYSQIKRMQTDEKPDVIIGSSVHLFTVLGAFQLSKKWKVPFIMEIRDLWPETLIQMGISKWHPFILFMGFLERYLYKRVKTIITNLPKANLYIDQITKGKVPVHWVSNGVNMKPFEQKIASSKSERFTILYTGSIGLANNMMVFMRAALAMKDQKEVLFKIVGSGAEKEDLIEFKEKHRLENVEFGDVVPKSEMPQLLASADVLFVAIKDLDLYKYGISLNKLYDYLAARKPVISAISSANNPIAEAKAGIEIGPDDDQALVKAIEQLKGMSKEEREHMGENGYSYVDYNFSIRVLSDKMIDIIESAQ